MMQHSFSDGKYTVINNNGILTALRHGEPWDRNLTGDNLIYWMLIEVDTLKQQRDELLEALRPFANYACDEPCKCHNCQARSVIAKATGGAA
jgi:hypothetical protein